MATSHTIPRLVIAGVSSNVGKTTVVVALARTLREQGRTVAVFKCGPDYLDPTYHSRVAGVPCHNLVGWMMGKDAVVETFVRQSRGADIALIEGVMGLYDGASATEEAGSTAQIAKWLRAPVVLVVDASGMARTIAAVAQGFATFDAEVNLAGLVCNRVGSRGHLDLLRRAQRQPAILGGLPKAPELAFPGRHLGLHTADQTVSDEQLAAWGSHAAEWIDLKATGRVAESAPALESAVESARPDDSTTAPSGPLPALSATPSSGRPASAKDDSQSADTARKPAARCRIGIAFDDAFHFYYEDNLSRLQALGAELIRFSPMSDRRLPPVDGLYFGGGYPELFADSLGHNRAMIDDIRAFADKRGPIYAECGGLMYLARAIRNVDGKRTPMVGLLPTEATVFDRLQALGYVEVETLAPSVLGPTGLRFRGHQFRYSQLEEVPHDLGRAYTVRKRRGGRTDREGYQVGSVLASYVHAHWASNPLVARGFVEVCNRARERVS